jgi:hypothetical protein
VKENGMETGIAEKDLQNALGGGVTFEDYLDVPL